MKLSRDWIASYVDLPSSVEEVADRLTAAGHAVEGIEEVPGVESPSSESTDWVLDIDITTNRPDCMNHFGMARELSVLFDRPLELPPADFDPSGDEAAEDVVSIHIDAPDLCHRFAARVVRGVKIGPSPNWLQRRLEAIGLRPINNVVDITNFVLWELGQPLHAYDLAKLQGATVRAREARAGETLTTLDGEKRKLEAGMLVIADAEEAIGLGGVMGGLDSEVTEETVDVLLEGAFFDPVSVRRTSGALGMHTDASHRFERGADIGMPPRAVDRAAALVAGLAGGTVLPGAIDVFPNRPESQVIDLHLRRLNRFAGVELAAEDVERWLTGLGFDLEAFPSDDDLAAWRVTVPTWRRRDVELPADLYEEVVRVYGYDNIPATLPAIHGADGHTSDAHRRGWALRRRLAACGFNEAITFAFHGAEEDALLPGLLAEHPALELANPLSELYRVMRRSLLPNLLARARFNQRRGAAAVQLFEIGHVFARAQHSDGADGEEPIVEFETVALVAGGEVGGPWDRSRELDFFDLKGVVEQLSVDVEQSLEARPAQLSGLAPGTTAELWAGDRRAGYLGLVLGDDDVYPLFAAELRTDLLAARPQPIIEVPSRFPGVRADLTLTHSVDIPWADLAAAIRAAAPEHLVDFGLQDRYQGEGVPDGAVNTTIYFLYSSVEGTLTQEEVNERQGGLAQELERRFSWKG